MMMTGVAYKIEIIKMIGEAPQNVSFLFSFFFIFPSR